MDTPTALHILEALAEGVSPSTGEAFPPDSPYQEADTVRALLVAVRALEAIATTPAARTQRTGNAGKPWSREEDDALLAAFETGVAIEALAGRHGRSRLAIEARLAKFGKVPMPSGLRSPAARPGADAPHAGEPAVRYATRQSRALQAEALR